MQIKHTTICHKKIQLSVLLTLLMFFLVGWTTPDKDPFYKKVPLLGGSPGDIIDARESVFTLNPFTKTPYPSANTWQIIYQSENATGETIAVSGTILVPTTPWLFGERPIIGFSAATRGLGDSCAPSFTLSNGIDYEGASIASILKMGWAVAISDYEGLGTPRPHTYMVEHSQGRVALDVIRAAQRLPEARLSPDAPVALMGYSQGGGAAGWAAQLASTYAPELKIIAAALGGVPADLEATGRFLNGKLFMALAFMASVGLDAAYEDLNLNSYLNERGVELQANAKNMCLMDVMDFNTKLSTVFSTIEEHTITSPIEDPLWQFRMAQQRLGEVALDIPVLLYHGTQDEMVPFDPAAKLRQDWCNLGVSVKWIPLYFVEHLIVLGESPFIALPWLEARFRGMPAIDNCPH
jgi:pimeloyl-ACP methyl ester carboxylesterase